MRALLTALPGLACVGMMLFICLPMLMHRGQSSEDAASKKELEELRAEVARLSAESASKALHDEHV